MSEMGYNYETVQSPSAICYNTLSLSNVRAGPRQEDTAQTESTESHRA